MCLSTAYLETPGTTEALIMDRVAKIRVKEGHVELEDLMGRTVSVTGMVQHVDLLENKIMISQKSSM